jgi:signal transduction histidine kinase/CheY-like chemotaxis protein
LALVVTALGGDRLGQAVALISTSVQRKLLLAFAIVVALFLTVGALGLGVLSQANNRVDALGQLPQRLAVYQQLETDSTQLNGDLTMRSNTIALCFNVSRGPDCIGDQAQATQLAENDGEIASTLDLMDPLTDAADLGFAPPPDETRLLQRIHSTYVEISTAMQAFKFDDENGSEAYPNNVPEINENQQLGSEASDLVGLTQRSTANLIAQNQASYLASQHLFIGVAVASAALAIVLAFILARTLTGPIRKMDKQLAAIASGDFSRHVEVENRDELGALAANLNRMNDELGRVYQELAAASQHKSEFLANMSHELRTPLNAVIGFSDVLGDQTVGDLNEKQLQYLGAINTSGRHLLTLINDILDLAKIEAGRMELQVTAFEFNDTLSNSVALFREQATRQGIRLRLESDQRIGVIDADERLLKQVLFNLISNALHFTPRGGRVEVSARQEIARVLISVRDDGAGIAPEDQARIFESFEQAGRSTFHEGTGLGLALSRRFVELHGGHLNVESAAGHGSTFTFDLPIATRSKNVESSGDQDAAASSEISARVSEGTPGRPADGRLALIVEDNERNLLLTRDLLQRHGFRTLDAGDAESGLELAATMRPDVILMDVKLPGMDGVTALARLRADPATATITVVAVTASVMPLDRERFALAGFAGVILKPVDVRTFPAEVLSYCRHGSVGADVDGRKESNLRSSPPSR